jgi:hypothetical protein
MIEFEKKKQDSLSSNRKTSTKELVGIIEYELSFFRESNKNLKRFGPEWITEWIKT